MIRMGVSGWMFLLVPAYPGCPGSKAVKRSSLLLLLSVTYKKLQYYPTVSIINSLCARSVNLYQLARQWLHTVRIVKSK